MVRVRWLVTLLLIAIGGSPLKAEPCVYYLAAVRHGDRRVLLEYRLKNTSLSMEEVARRAGVAGSTVNGMRRGEFASPELWGRVVAVLDPPSAQKKTENFSNFAEWMDYHVRNGTLERDEIAQRAGIGKQHVTDLRTGKIVPSADVAAAIAKALGRPPAEGAWNADFTETEPRFGEWLAALRKSQSLSLTELAAATGLSLPLVKQLLRDPRKGITRQTAAEVADSLRLPREVVLNAAGFRSPRNQFQLYLMEQVRVAQLPLHEIAKKAGLTEDRLRRLLAESYPTRAEVLLLAKALGKSPESALAEAQMKKDPPPGLGQWLRQAYASAELGHPTANLQFIAEKIAARAGINSDVIENALQNIPPSREHMLRLARAFRASDGEALAAAGFSTEVPGPNRRTSNRGRTPNE